MSYPRDLDEIPMEELRAEIDRRERLRIAGLCDYCGKRLGRLPACRFPARHGVLSTKEKSP